MLKRVNKAECKENRWPCLFCDEWAWDVLS